VPIDVHAHYSPKSIIDALEDKAGDYGLSLVKHPPSCQCALHFDYGLKVRPFFAKLIEPVEERLAGMDEQGVDHQVLSMWSDIFAYGLPRETGARWHRLLNEHLGAVCAAVCRQPGERRVTRSDRIDRVVMHPVWGVPIFLATMYIVFTLTFTVGTPFMDLIDQGFGWLADTLLRVWPAGQAEHLQSLVVDGVIGGVGGVIVFLPNIVLLFLAIAVLEGTGYMARAAFVMDRFMSKVGLHGKSFIPLLIGFGCTVPAIMATRTLETRRDRIITMMVLPLMSCGARLPIYALMIPAFFAPKWQGPVLWIIYVTGILLAMGGAMLLRSTMFRGETTPFLMELPPYRMPTWKGLSLHMWDRGWMYLRKAGTVILMLSIIMWVAISYPKPSESKLIGLTEHEQEALVLQHSVAGRVGHIMEPVIKPLGFDWKIGTALIGASVAKEVFVSQLSIIYSLGDGDTAEETEALQQHLREDYSALQGFCVMLFCLITAPCVATVAITRKESGTWKWALFQYLGLTAMAYIITLAVYQTGMLLTRSF